MNLVLGLLAWNTCLVMAGPNLSPGGYLQVPVTLGDGPALVRAVPYYPSEGDIVLFDDHSQVWQVLYKIVGSGMPDHSGMVVKLPDGSMALLEAGPDDFKLAGPYVRLLEALPRLHCYQGTVYIRKLKRRLNPDQSAALTHFAMEQEGKRYAIGRLLLQATPCRCRSGWRAKVFGHTYTDRSSWLCAELVVAAGTVAGLFDPNIHHANRIYPLDLTEDKTFDLRSTWDPAFLWTAKPNTVSDQRNVTLGHN
jgi:hypothetical protein